jgi:hypothetical protein
MEDRLRKEEQTLDVNSITQLEQYLLHCEQVYSKYHLGLGRAHDMLARVYHQQGNLKKSFA